MNTNGLARHYGALSPAERLALMLSAGVRGDDVEHGRLVDAAPRETWRVPHTFGRALAFLGVFCQHRMERLELIGTVLQNVRTCGRGDGQTGRAAARRGRAVRLPGDRLRRGVAQFCTAEQLDPSECEAVAPGGVTLEQAGREAEAVGFTPNEAQEYVRRGGADAPAKSKTAESVAGELRAAFAFLLKQWE